MTVLPKMREAMVVLKAHADAACLAERIRLADPYVDKRFAPVMARWVVLLGVSPEEHADDVVRFKLLRRGLKSLRVPAKNVARVRAVRDLLAVSPSSFLHYSLLQEWNEKASLVLDPSRDLSDEGLPVEMRYGGYTMYRIDRLEHCDVPLVRNTMSWCVVTKRNFGTYGGPPYYAIVRDEDRSPFCMVIPAWFDENTDEAVRNANNDDRLSFDDVVLLRPLLKHVLPLSCFMDPFVYGIHGVGREHVGSLDVEGLLPREAFDMSVDMMLEVGDWPEGERMISMDAESSYNYAREVVGGPWPPGEGAIALDPRWALRYAKDVIGGRWHACEAVVSRSEWASGYAFEVVGGAWPDGEEGIGADPYCSLHYARMLGGRFERGEAAIARDAGCSYFYACLLGGRFEMGEDAIARDAYCSRMYARFLGVRFERGEAAIAAVDIEAALYAHEVIGGRFVEGEVAIARDHNASYLYAVDVLGARWLPGEAAIRADARLWDMYLAFLRNTGCCGGAVQGLHDGSFKDGECSP